MNSSGNLGGEVFRTTSNATGTNFNAWRMYTGAGVGTEKFVLYTTTSLPNNVTLQSSQGAMSFNTGTNGTAYERMRILANGHTDIGSIPLMPSSWMFFSSDKLNIVGGDLRIGEVTNENSGIDAAGGYGRHLIFSGGPDPLSNVNSDNSDLLWIARCNMSEDLSRLRIYVGDNTGPTTTTKDMLEIGGSLSTDQCNPLNEPDCWYSYMVVGDGGPVGAPGRVGINTVSPRSGLEINMEDINPSTTIGGKSGLQFQDLTTATTPIENQGTGVLSVDGDGKVIYVKENNSAGFGAACSGPATFDLTDDWRVGLSGNNFYFSGNNSGNLNDNSVFIGDDCLSPDKGKLVIHQKSGTEGSTILYAQNDDNIITTGQTNYGIKCYVNEPSNMAVKPTHIAGVFSADNALNKIAGVFTANKIAFADEAHAIWIPQNGGNLAINVKYTDLGLTSTNSVYINGGIMPDYAVYINGDILHNGDYNPSDIILKKEIADFSDGISVIRSLRPVSYKFNGLAGYDTSGIRIGIIAEELQEIAPYALGKFYAKLDSSDISTTELLSVNTEPLLFASINAIQELDSVVTILQNTTPPNKPILSYPADDAMGIPLSVTLSWEKCERAQSYSLFVSGSGGMGRVPGSMFSFNITTADTFALVTLPAYFSVYHWHVLAYNSAGSSDISGNWSFTTLMPPAPLQVNLVSPLNASTSLPLANTFSWNSSEFADQYTLYISAGSDFGNIVSMVNSTDTFANASVPDYNNKYYWWVVASNISGQSPESDKREFATLLPPPPPQPPVLAFPVNGDTITGPGKQYEYTWNPSVGATSYTFYISLTPDESGLIYNSVSVDTFSFVQSLNAYDTTYYWWVEACNQYSCGDKSEVSSFYYKNRFSLDNKSLSESTLSDSALKINVTPITNALDLLVELLPVRYYWDTLHYSWLPSTEQIGLLGQQVNTVVPDAVFKDTAGYYNIQYSRLVALLVEGMKEQQLQIDSMKNMIQALNSTGQKSTENNINGSLQENMQTVDLADFNAIILNQNDPNPFAEETNISYFLPEDVAEAKIMFYDNSGKIIKTVELTGKGNGSLHVYASNLSAGIYTYALVADGNVIDTKKMVCTKQ